MFSPLVSELIAALRVLPSVGPKSAQRMALHLLERNRQGGVRLSDALAQAMSQVSHCQECRTFTEEELCQICANPARDRQLLCVVESPADILAIEQSGSYSGFVFCFIGTFIAFRWYWPARVRYSSAYCKIKTWQSYGVGFGN